MLRRFPQYNTINNLYREFYIRHWSANSIEGRNFGAGNCCCRVVNGLFTTVTSCFLRTRVKGSVTPLTCLTWLVQIS